MRVTLQPGINAVYLCLFIFGMSFCTESQSPIPIECNWLSYRRGSNEDLVCLPALKIYELSFGYQVLLREHQRDFLAKADKVCV